MTRTSSPQKGRRLLLAAVAVATLAILAGPQQAIATGSACPTSNPPNELVVDGGSGQTAQLGKQFESSLQVKLANSNGCSLTGNLAGINVDFVAPAGGASGTFATTGTKTAVAGTNDQGVATAPAFTANDTTGSYSVHAESDYGTVKLYLANSASGLAASISTTAGDNQQATVNSQYSQPLQARITDADGNPVQGATVDFAVSASPYGASASFLTGGNQASRISNADGIATSPALVANASPGHFTATASIADLSSVANFTLDNHATTNTLAAITETAQTTTVGTSYARPLSVRLLDANGQPLEGAPVTFALTVSAKGAGATYLDGTTRATELTDADGQAVSPRLRANSTAGSFIATASVTGIANPLTYPLRNLAGTPSTISAGPANGQSTRAGRRFPIPLAVTVKDIDDNPVAGTPVTFIAPAHGPSGHFTTPRRDQKHLERSRLARTRRIVKVTTNKNGIAVAPPFTANTKSGGYVVIARAGVKRTAFALVNSPR